MSKFLHRKCRECGAWTWFPPTIDLSSTTCPKCRAHHGKLEVGLDVESTSMMPPGGNVSPKRAE